MFRLVFRILANWRYRKCVVLRSGWIRTGLRTKLLEKRLAAFIEAVRVDIDCNVEENLNFPRVLRG